MHHLERRAGLRALILLGLLATTLVGCRSQTDCNSWKGVELQSTESGLTLGMFLTTDAQGQYEVWDGPTEELAFSFESQVSRGETIYAIILLQGCKSGADGNCDVEARFKIDQPDETVHVEDRVMDVVRGRPVAPNTFVIGDRYFIIRITPTDPNGRYVVYAEITDNNSGERMILQSPFMVVDDDA
ncbi:MAG: hypothetical protein AAFQ62_04585 [Pseudomonadota bacterium]